MKEQWQDVAGYKGFYQASDLGRIKSLDRIVIHRLNGPVKLKGKVLSPGMTGPYLSVSLSKGGIQTTVRVHRLVAEAWLGPCPDGMEVCHGEGGQLDNSISNLSYGTRSDNNFDKRRDGTHRGRPVRRSDGVKFINMHIAAEETGCHQNSICRVCKGKQKTSGGYGWTYL